MRPSEWCNVSLKTRPAQHCQQSNSSNKEAEGHEYCLLSVLIIDSLEKSRDDPGAEYGGQGGKKSSGASEGDVSPLQRSDGNHSTTGVISHLHHHPVDQMNVAVGALDIRPDNPGCDAVIVDEADGFYTKKSSVRPPRCKTLPPFSMDVVTLRGGPLITSTPPPAWVAAVCRERITWRTAGNTYQVCQGHFGTDFQMSLEDVVYLVVEISHKEDL